MFCRKAPNGSRYLRWGGDGEAVQPEKCSGVEKCLRCAQNPQRQVHALLARFLLLEGYTPLPEVAERWVVIVKPPIQK